MSFEDFNGFMKLGLTPDLASDIGNGYGRRSGRKANWDSVFDKNENGFEIWCPHDGCMYRTLPSEKCFYKHCIEKHKWGEYKCHDPFENCKYVAHNKE